MIHFHSKALSILTSGAKKERQNSLRLFCRFNHYFAVDLVMIMPYLGKQTLSHLHVNAAIYFAQMLKICARKWPIFQRWGCDRIPCIAIPYAYVQVHFDFAPTVAKIY